MIRPGVVLAAVALMSATDRVAHARMAMQTFPVLAGAGPHDVYPAPDGTVWFTAQRTGNLILHPGQWLNSLRLSYQWLRCAARFLAQPSSIRSVTSPGSLPTKW